jgi:hypothetical protein
MQVLCVATEELEADLTCKICGNKYKLYFERSSAVEQATAMTMVVQTLINHHASGQGHSVHPEIPFNVPEWSGSPQWSGAALLGGAPEWLHLQAEKFEGQ